MINCTIPLAAIDLGTANHWEKEVKFRKVDDGGGLEHVALVHDAGTMVFGYNTGKPSQDDGEDNCEVTPADTPITCGKMQMVNLHMAYGDTKSSVTLQTTVAACHLLGGADIGEVKWDGGWSS